MNQQEGKPPINTIPYTLVVTLTIILFSCVLTTNPREQTSQLFRNPERIMLLGYDGDALEPFITCDGLYLLFNNLNDQSINTNLHYAERIDDLTFCYKGELKGINTQALEGVPTLDRQNILYFVSDRSYDKTLSTIYRGTFLRGEVTGIDIVAGVSRQRPGIVNFDVEVSPDGNTLYFVEAQFAGGGPQTADIVIAGRRGAVFQRTLNSDQIMKHINTAALEYAPCISADGLMLLFTRAGTNIIGGAAIYLAQRNKISDPFGKPMRLSALKGFVEGPALSPNERFLYYHKKEGKTLAIFRATR